MGEIRGHVLLKYFLGVFLFCLFGFFLRIDSAEAAYSYYRTITVTSTDTFASGTLNNFPMLVNISSSSYLQDISTGGRVNNASGYDIIFSASSSCVNPLYFERERYNSSTGELVAWVNVPTSTAGTVTHLCYGDTSVTTDQSSSTATWNSNFKGVWHHKETATNTSAYILDSTSNANNGSSTASSYPTPSSTGQIDGAQSFDGTNDRIFSNTSYSSTFTLAMWIYPRSLGLINQGIMAYIGGYLRLNFPSANRLRLNAECFSVELEEATYYLSPVSSITLGQWSHVAVTANNPYTTAQFYINGASVTTSRTECDGTPNSIANYLNIGSQAGQGVGDPSFVFDGLIDEIHLASTTLSAAWIKTSYNNQNTPSLFYTIGSEVSLVPAASGFSVSLPPSPTLSFFASPSSIPSGSSSTLIWSGTDITSCVLNGSPQKTSGTVQTGILTSNTFYNLVCYGGGGTVQKSIILDVSTPLSASSSSSASSSTIELESQILSLKEIIAKLQAQIKNLLLVKTKFLPGDKVITISPLRVRLVPSIKGKILKVLSKGIDGDILDGPVNLNGYNWWKVNYKGGVIGWSAGEYLEK